VPLAFAIMDKENNGSWGWFLRLVQRVVVGPEREICVILDKHVRILNVIHEVQSWQWVRFRLGRAITRPSATNR
jgi:hypothetical protein